MVGQGVKGRARATSGALVIAMSIIIAVGALAAGTPPAGAGSGAPSFPPPSGFSGGGGLSVSCTGPTDCTSIGSAGSASTEVNGAWGTPVQLSAVSSSAVSCTGLGECTALGQGAGSVSVYEVETGGTWGAAAAFPTPQNGTFSDQVSGVSASYGGNLLTCPTLGNCTAVGYISGQNLEEPAVTSETGGTWSTPSIVEAVLPGWLPAPDSSSAGFNGVSCVDPTDCTAVGTESLVYGGSTTYVGMEASETNGVWTDAEPLDGTGPLVGVSCPDAADCTAVGTLSSQGADNPVYVTEAAGSWGTGSEFSGAVPPGQTYSTATGEFHGVSCIDATDCVAVGGDANGAPTYAIEMGGTWGLATEATSQDYGSGDGFDAVTCTSAIDCTAVGAGGTGGYYSITNTPAVGVTDDGPVVAGQTLTFTATVTGPGTPTPTGPTNWNVIKSGGGSTPCTSTTGPSGTSNVATYSCSIAGVASGSYAATASFAGDANYAAATGSDTATVIDACQPGTYSTTGGVPCTPADPGSDAPTSGATQETACTAGTYSPAPGAASCTPADPGSDVPTSGATQETACTAGTYSPAPGAASCTPADPGSDVPTSGATQETACTAGTYSPAPGAASCTPADPGSDVPTSGATQETACTAGTYSPAPGAASCTPADPGSDVPTSGATQETACTAGTYSPAPGAASCTPADPGSDVPTSGATQETACTAGTYSPAPGAASCTPQTRGATSRPPVRPRRPPVRRHHARPRVRPAAPRQTRGATSRPPVRPRRPPVRPAPTARPRVRPAAPRQTRGATSRPPVRPRRPPVRPAPTARPRVRPAAPRQTRGATSRPPVRPRRPPVRPAPTARPRVRPAAPRPQRGPTLRPPVRPILSIARSERTTRYLRRAPARWRH